MTKPDKAPSTAAWVIVGSMLIHNMNALRLEPTYPGFVDKARDYGDMSKILNAQFSSTRSSAASSTCSQSWA